MNKVLEFLFCFVIFMKNYYFRNTFDRYHVKTDGISKVVFEIPNENYKYTEFLKKVNEIMTRNNCGPIFSD